MRKHFCPPNSSVILHDDGDGLSMVDYNGYLTVEYCDQDSDDVVVLAAGNRDNALEQAELHDIYQNCANNENFLRACINFKRM